MNDKKRKKRRGNYDQDIEIFDLVDYSEEEEQPKRRKSAHRKHVKPKPKKQMRNKEFARVTYFFVALFLFMVGYIVYFQVVRSKDIINNPYNQRQNSFAERIVRGKILDRDGNVLAQTNITEEGKETREYPYGNIYAHVIGYTTRGNTGLESVNNFELLTSNAFVLERMMKELQDEKNIGDNIITTLDTRVQKAAYDALGNNRGAVIAIEPSTGKILACVSKPDFNPNTIENDWEVLNDSESSVLLNRATQGKYAPGSTFKMVSTLAYMRTNSNFPTYSFECTGSFEYEGTTIHCINGKAHGTVNLEGSVAYSCNSSFSNMGLQSGVEKIKDVSGELLFDKKLPSPLQASNSQLGLTKDSNSANVMMTSIGQGELQVSPYHMALIASAIANQGTLMKPYLVSEVQNYTGSTVSKHTPTSYGDLMTMEEASWLGDYMKAVVQYGTGTSLNGRSYSVAGKTGTAEVSMDKITTHSWFMGYRNVENPDMAICVIVENSNESDARSINIAGKVFDAYN